MTDKAQAALLKYGTVVESASGHASVRFDDLDGMVSQPLKVVTTRAHKDKSHHGPDVGALVACVVDQNLEDGVVLGEVYSDADPPATDNPALWHWKMADGSEFSFDRDSGKLHIKTTSDISLESGTVVSLKASEKIVLDAPIVAVLQDLSIGGGIDQGGGNGGKAIFAGLVESLSDFVAKGKSLVNHRHKENGPGSETDPTS